MYARVPTYPNFFYIRFVTIFFSSSNVVEIGGSVMVFNAIFNNISVISWRVVKINSGTQNTVFYPI